MPRHGKEELPTIGKVSRRTAHRILAVPVLLMASAGMIWQPAAAQAPVDGAMLFKQRCSACHQVDSRQKSGVGPNLAGVVGRKAGSATFNYSPALQKSGLNWTRVNLDKYLAGPAKLVPGTRMAVSLSSPEQRAAIISYLAQAK